MAGSSIVDEVLARAAANPASWEAETVVIARDVLDHGCPEVAAAMLLVAAARTSDE